MRFLRRQTPVETKNYFESFHIVLQLLDLFSDFLGKICR